MRHFYEAFALSSLGFLIMAGSPVMAASVISSPVQVSWKSGNAEKECQAATQLTGITYRYGYKIDGWNAGIKGDYVAQFDDGIKNTLSIIKNDGTYFDWNASNGVGVVIVKGGTKASIFPYEKASQGDSGMVSPNNASGKPAEVSHATFCWNQVGLESKGDNEDGKDDDKEGGKDDDKDDDKIIDSQDAFPLDPDRVTQRFYPNGSDYGYLAFEDNWPSKGDFDANDLVVGYRAIETLNAKNEVTDLKLVYEIVARGGTAQIGFGVHLPGIAAASINKAATTLQVGAEAPQPLAVESGQAEAVFILSPLVNKLTTTGLSWPCGFFNTVARCPRSEPVTLVADIHFQQPLSAGQLADAPYNPFIYRTNRGREIHLIDHPPTAKADLKLFGTGDDRSNPSAGRYYRTADNLPWVLDIPETWQYPAEWNNVTNAYPEFNTWWASEGKTSRDWYISNINQSLVFNP